MTAMLVIVTFGALVLAGASAFYLLRVTRQERERSQARAAALADALGTTMAELMAEAESDESPEGGPEEMPRGRPPRQSQDGDDPEAR